jgi:hypothetical protein
MSSEEEKRIRVKKLRIVADQLIVEPSRIIIKRPGKEEREEREEELGLEGESLE